MILYKIARLLKNRKYSINSNHRRKLSELKKHKIKRNKIILKRVKISNFWDFEGSIN